MNGSSSSTRNLIFPVTAGMTAVILGAFGAHGLESRGLAAESLRTWETAVEYQFYHALALIGLFAVSTSLPATLVAWTRRLWTVGLLLFSGSLYALVLDELAGQSWTFLGPVTPLGGTLMIAGWACLLVAVWRAKEA